MRLCLNRVGSVRVRGEEESGGDRGENENIKRGNDEVQAGGGDEEWKKVKQNTN